MRTWISPSWNGQITLPTVRKKAIAITTVFRLEEKIRQCRVDNEEPYPAVAQIKGHFASMPSGSMKSRSAFQRRSIVKEQLHHEAGSNGSKKPDNERNTMRSNVMDIIERFQARHALQEERETQNSHASKQWISQFRVTLPHEKMEDQGLPYSKWKKCGYGRLLSQAARNG